MKNKLPIIEVLKSSLENINQLSSDMLKKAGKSKVIPSTYKKMMTEISTASTATLLHLHTLEEELEKLT